MSMMTTTTATVRLAERGEAGASPCIGLGCERWIARTGKAGRPADYCSPECREVTKLLGRLGAVLRTVAARATCEATLRALTGEALSHVNVATNAARARLRRERVEHDSRGAPRVSGAETVGA